MNNKSTLLLLLLTFLLLNTKAQTIIDNGDTLIPSRTAVGGNLFLGYGKMTGNLSEYFSNQYFAGINVDVSQSNFIFQFDDYIGFGKTKKTITFEDNTQWEEDKPAFSFMVGLNVGYAIYNTTDIKVVPVIGICGDGLDGSGVASENKPFLPFYKTGIYVDLKCIPFLDDRAYSKISSYSCLRLSAGLNSPLGTINNKGYFKGSMIYFTIGMAGQIRFFKNINRK